MSEGLCEKLKKDNELTKEIKMQNKIKLPERTRQKKMKETEKEQRKKRE